MKKRHLQLIESEEIPPPPPVSAGDDAPLLQVGELAKQSGKTVRAIHLYEDLGLLTPQDRSVKGRYRLFNQDALLRVRWIGKLQSLGLSLSKIQTLAREQEDSESAQFAAGKLSEIYATKLRETQQKILELRALERELEASVRYLDGCDTSCEPHLPTDSCTSCSRYSDAPELIAGVRAHH